MSHKLVNKNILHFIQKRLVLKKLFSEFVSSDHGDPVEQNRIDYPPENTEARQ